MGYQHGASRKVAASTRKNNRPDERKPIPPPPGLANGFDEGWETWRNENGTRNAGRADRGALLAYLAFHGREAFDKYRGPYRFLKDRIRVQDVDYKIPLHGVLAHFTFEGRDKLLQISHAKGPWEDYHSDTREAESERKRIGRMLSGTEELHSGWLEMLGYGLDLTDTARRNLWQLFGSAKVSLGTTPDHEAKAIANFIEQHALRAQDRSKFAERRVASELVDIWRERIEQLASAPAGYPDTLGVPVLAEMLSVAHLDEGWEKEYEGLQGLYSGMNNTGSTRALDAVFGNRRVIVLGDPGHGKSTLLAGAALRALEQGAPVLFARLEDLGAASSASRNKQEWCLPSDRGMRWAAEMLLEAGIASGLPWMSKHLRETAVKQIVADRDLLIVLDGWDEVSTEENRNGAQEALKLLSGHGSGTGGVKGRVLLASRVTGYRRPAPGFQEVLVTQLDPDTVMNFFEVWFAGEEGRDALARVRKSLENPRLAGLARIPVLAGFIAVVAKDEKPRSSKQGIYEQYLERFLARAWKDGSPTRRSYAEIQERLHVASIVAWKMATWPSQDPYKNDQWEDHLSIRELGSWSTSQLHASSTDWYRQVEDLAVSDGLLVPHGRLVDVTDGQQRYRWLHRTIHEHLVGRHLMNLVRTNPNEGLAGVRQVLLRPSWEEALEHAAGFFGQENLADVVASDLWEYRNERDFEYWVTRRLVQICSDSGAEAHRSELTAELLSRGYYALAAELDPATTTSEIQKRLSATISDDDRVEMALALEDIPGIESLELCLQLEATAQPFTHTISRILNTKLLEHDRQEAQRHALKEYESERVWHLAEWCFVRADKNIAELVAAKIRKNSSFEDCAAYVGALAARGYEDGKERSRERDAESRELLLAALPAGAEGELLAAYFERRISQPEWSGDMDWMTPDLRAKLATQEDVRPAVAFHAGGYVHSEVPEDWKLTPWARVGYAAGATSFPERALSRLSEWSRERVQSAIAVALVSPLCTTPDVVEEFHWATAWALASKDPCLLSSVFEVLNRNYKHHPKWTSVWDTNHKFISRLEEMPWSVQWDLWKLEAVRCFPGIPNLSLGKGVASLPPEERANELRLVARWFVGDAPDEFDRFPISHYDYAQSPEDASLPVLAQELMSCVSSCSSKQKATTLLTEAITWHRRAETLEHFWPAIISMHKWIGSVRDWPTKEC